MRLKTITFHFETERLKGKQFCEHANKSMHSFACPPQCHCSCLEQVFEGDALPARSQTLSVFADIHAEVRDSSSGCGGATSTVTYHGVPGKANHAYTKGRNRGTRRTHPKYLREKIVLKK
jgi:hypothetical protein